ncbi:MAG: YraN family protein [Gemmatimonadales bacterium]|nr:YraN family protein [Gemmatimonadales bacterium]
MSTRRSASRLAPPSTWRDPRHQLGHDAELDVARFLTSAGWRVLAHRFRAGRSDIDLVVRRADVVAFVEVKARRTDACGDGLEAIGRAKQRQLARAAEWWCLRQADAPVQYRFDVVTVRYGPDGPSFLHLEDAWRSGE